MLEESQKVASMSNDKNFARLRAFLHDQRGAFAVHFAVACIPLLAFSGASIDYGFVIRTKMKLDDAVDTAALAAVGASTMTMDANGASASGLRVLQTLAGNPPYTTVNSMNVQVSDSGMTRSATASYTATVKLSFMPLVGISSTTVNGQATANFSRAPYIDFYILLDNTPSMGVGATTADINKMVASTSDKCAFACHDVSNSNSYYNLAKKLGVTMRIDVVRMATQQLTDTATATATVPDQFRMAVYTFGADATKMGLTTVAPLTTNLSTVKTQAGAIDLMTVPNSSYNSDQDTPLDTILTAMNTTIPAAGAGTDASNPQKVLFFVSDGVADQYLPSGCTKTTTGGRCQEPLTASLCTSLKARGVKIAVLYTTYLPLPTNSWYNTWISPWNSQISTNMQTCASPGLYFEVSPSGGIADAMTALFKQAILQARLTS
jgi:Flp pilus assembly protein TadG